LEFYLGFNDLSCSAKKDLIDFALQDYISRYGVNDIHNEMMWTGLDFEDVAYLKASEHMETIDIVIKGGK